jgi:plasmid maintenance system killer protein
MDRYIVLKDDHRYDPVKITPFEEFPVGFESKFHKTAKEQQGLNVLGGITFNLLNPRRNSIMVCWQYVDGLFDLYFRWYSKDKEFTSDKIKSVKVDQKFEFTFDYDDDDIIVHLDDEKLLISRDDITVKNRARFINPFLNVPASKLSWILLSRKKKK